MRIPRVLLVAIYHWRQGIPLPMDLADRLMSLGYDVPRLERRYSI
jgi:hypothetical protein